MDSDMDAEEELDTGLPVFLSPYKSYQVDSNDEYLDTGESGYKLTITPKPKTKTGNPNVRKRLSLTLDLPEPENETSTDAENNDITDCLPSTSAGKRRKKSSPKKVRQHLPTSSDDESRIPDHHKRTKGTTRIPSVQDVAKMCCCTNMCVVTMSLASIQTCRDSFSAKSTFEQRQWILDYLCQHSSVDTSTNKYKYMFVIGTVVVCTTAWRLIHGITERRYYSIKKKFEAGLRTFETPNSCKQAKHNTEIMESLAWLEYYAMTFGDKLPHMNDDVYHLPSCLSKKDVYKLLVDDFKQTNRTPCSESYFYVLWTKNYKTKIVIPKENISTKCDCCTKTRFKLENHKLSSERRLRYIQKRETHLKL